MSQLFGPQMNWIVRIALIGVPVFLIVTVVVAEVLDRSDYVTQKERSVDQPIPFSHLHHVGQLKIDCRYCHQRVETDSIAGLPSAATCLTCHSQVWRDAPLLRPLHESQQSGSPLAWSKVTKLPDFVYFNHSIHVTKGVACTECHGQVEDMSLTRLAQPMTMEFCLDCHRDPSSKVTSLTPHSARTDCITCHR